MTTIVPNIVKRTFLTTRGAPSDGTSEASITISTAAVDREQDEVLPEGMNATGYQKSPVVLWAHDHRSPPVARTNRLIVDPGRSIRAEFSFVKGDAFADRIRNIYEQDLLAASIGFRPLKWTPNEHGGLRFIEWEFLEWSLVPVPANPEAVRTLKRFGLDGPSPVAHVSVALQQLTTELKAGRVLSTAQEQQLADAARSISGVLAAPNTESTTDPEPVALHLLVDGKTVPIAPALLDTAISRGIEDAVTAATGRLPNATTPALFVTEPSAPVIRISEEHLTALVTDTIRDAVMRVTGRVD